MIKVNLVTLRPSKIAEHPDVPKFIPEGIGLELTTTPFAGMFINIENRTYQVQSVIEVLDPEKKATKIINCLVQPANFKDVQKALVMDPNEHPEEILSRISKV